MKQTISATLAFAAFALVFACPGWAATPKTHLGTYVFSGGSKQKKALAKAIKGISSKMNFFVRGRVHSGLTKAFAIQKQITIKMVKGKLVIQSRSGKPLMSGMNGKPTAIQGKKGVFFLTRTWSGNTLKETLQPKGKKGYRRNIYTFRKDGKTMVLRTVSFLARLKRKISYTLVYTKK